MSGLNCKTVVCVGGCISAMVTPELNEITKFGIIPLAAADDLKDDQYNDLIAMFEEFDSMAFTHDEQKKEEVRMAKEVEKILLRY